MTRRTLLSLIAALFCRPRWYARPTVAVQMKDGSWLRTHYGSSWMWDDDAVAWSKVGPCTERGKFLVTIGYKGGRVERYAARGWEVRHRGVTPFYVPIDGERLS